MHGSLVTSSLVRETTGESQNYGYKFGQEEETYNIVAATVISVDWLEERIRLFWELMRTVVPPLLLAAWPVVGIWFTALLGISTMALPERIQLQSVCAGFSRSGDCTWADVLNRAIWGWKVMHERNAHNFPLDLASGEAVPVPEVPLLL